MSYKKQLKIIGIHIYIIMTLKYYDVAFDFPNGKKLSFSNIPMKEVIKILPKVFMEELNAPVKASRNIVYNLIAKRNSKWFVQNYCKIKYHTP